jgi:hypothetical protein
MAKKAEKPERKPPAKQAEAPAAAPAKKVAAPSKPAAAAPANSPLIDTSIAANTAAALIANKAAKSSGGSAATPPKKESAAFKQLKAGLNKPSAGAMGGAFGIAGQQKKSHLPHAGGKQVGHNQTFGADVNRTGVPRRTPG